VSGSSHPTQLAQVAVVCVRLCKKILLTNILFLLPLLFPAVVKLSTVVATHPWKPNQIAVGMSDGAVLVLEPLDTDDVQVGSDVT